MKYQREYYKSLELPEGWKWFGYSDGKHFFRKEIATKRFTCLSFLEYQIEDRSFLKKLKK